MSENKNFIDNLPPKTAFKFGLFSGLAVMFVVGFFIVLGLLINAKSDFFNSNTKNNNTNPTANNNINQPAATGDLTKMEDLSKADWLRGDKNAEITIVEYSDIDCPFCKDFHDTMVTLLENYDGEINWVYRHFPLTSLHPNAFTKAEAVECAGSLGGNDKFWELTDKLIQDKTITVDKLADAAAQMGIDKTKFQKCMDNHDFTQKIQDQTNDAIEAGGQGTPFSVIIAGDQRIAIPGALPIERLTPQLDTLLK